jgi:hypothetical protein
MRGRGYFLSYNMKNSGKITKARNEIPYAQIPNAILRDKSLSFKAKGLLSFLLSLPDDWVIYKLNLAEYSTDGYTAVASAWDELENAGYVSSTRVTDELGRFQGWEHTVHFEPQPKGKPDDKGSKPENDKPETGESGLGEPDFGKPENGEDGSIQRQSLTNTDSTKKEKQKGKSKKSEVPAKPIIDPVEEFVSIFESNEYRLAARDFLQHRKELKSPATPSSLNRIAKDFKKWGEASSVVALERSIKNGWVGVFKPSQKDIDEVKAEKPTGYEHLIGYRADLQNNPDYRFNISPDGRCITYNKKW